MPVLKRYRRSPSFLKTKYERRESGTSTHRSASTLMSMVIPKMIGESPMKRNPKSATIGSKSLRRKK